MFRGYRIIICIPAGRQRYLEILAPYLEGLRPVVDSVHFWVNTRDPDDLDYIRSVASLDAWFQLIDPPKGTSITRILWHSVHVFYAECTDPYTIYVKLDDDLVYMDPLDKFTRFLDARIDNPDAFVVSANVLNNPLFTHLLQERGVLSSAGGVVGRDSQDLVGMSGESAADVHSQVLAALETGDTSGLRVPDVSLKEYERFGINCIAWFGKDFAEFDGAVPQRDETFLTEDMPRQLSRPVLVSGDFMVVHFAFLLQRRYLEDHTDALERYRRLSASVASGKGHIDANFF